MTRCTMSRQSTTELYLVPYFLSVLHVYGYPNGTKVNTLCICKKNGEEL